MTLEDAARTLEDVSSASWNAARSIIRTLNAAGHQGWIVGGCLRDALMGREAKDADVATGARPETVMTLFPRAHPTGLRHGTVTVVIDGQPVEVTTFRVESGYADARRPDRVAFVDRIEEDLGRRDFTVNALAFDPASGRLVDPFGGLEDMEKGILRAVGDPATRLREDGLRAFRAARLQVTLGFEIEPDTLEAIGRARAEAARVAPERIREELSRMLQGDRPSAGFETMRETGLLKAVLPELLEGYGVWQNRYHAFDVYHHTLAVVDHAPREKLNVRLAALLHDIGKPRTKVVVNGEGTFYNHQHVGARMARDILIRLRYPNDTIETVVRLVEHHMFHYRPDWSDAAVRRFLRQVGVDLVADLFDLRLADTLGNGRRSGFSDHLDQFAARIESELRKETALSVKDLAVDGRDIMTELHIPSGPRVGRVLRFLLDRVVEDPSLNRRDDLLDLARREFNKKD